MASKRKPLLQWHPRSLQSRQLWAASLGLIAFLALAGYALDRAFVDTAERGARQRLKGFVVAYAAGIDFLRNGEIYVPETPPDARFNRPASGLYAEVVLPNGRWRSISTYGAQLPDISMLEVRKEVFQGPLRVDDGKGGATKFYLFGIGYVWAGADPKSEFPYTICVIEDTTALDAQIVVFRRALWGYLGGAGVVLLLLQVLVLRWSLWPLRRVIGELKRVQRGALSRMSGKHPRELEPLTESINAFIQSERENLDRQRNTMSDLAHSLKTPLAVLRTRLDNGAGEAGLREDVDTQLRRMNDLVSYQLSRASAGGHALFAAPVAIEPLAEEIVRGLEKIYAAKGAVCEFDIDDEARFHGEPGDLQELLGNLLENGFKWAGSRVLLTVKAGATAPNRRAGLMLSVDDDGPGIPPDRIATVLQRGVRGDERVQGHGIGLAIVQDMVHSYGGELVVGASQELGGARFEVRLPAGL